LKGINLPFKFPSGVNTFQAIFVDKTMLEPGKLAALSTLRWLPLLILSIGAIVTFYKISRINKFLTNPSLEIPKRSFIVPYLMSVLISFIFL